MISKETKSQKNDRVSWGWFFLGLLAWGLVSGFFSISNYGIGSWQHLVIIFWNVCSLIAFAGISLSFFTGGLRPVAIEEKQIDLSDKVLVTVKAD